MISPYIILTDFVLFCFFLFSTTVVKFTDSLIVGQVCVFLLPIDHLSSFLSFSLLLPTVLIITDPVHPLH